MMLHLTFSFADIPKVLTVIFLECALSADNALVMTSLIEPLPSQRAKQRALWVGSASSFILRALAILFIASLIQHLWIQIIGALYLLYLAISYHFHTNRSEPKQTTYSQQKLWLVILKIECLDCLFAIDSIIAALAVVGISKEGSLYHSKIWIVYLGGMIGVLAIRFAVKLFSYLLKIFPKIKGATHVILGFVGLKLLTETLSYYLIQGKPYYEDIHHMIEGIFWIGLFLILFIAFFSKKAEKRSRK